ncbi:hypothetical protein PAAG_01748 [Paracoccidioides lutzii Pb01]|uniref:Uncharacterized protein n=1 Tax=Paracoccidioides lutzii (strain ATCC MYA-826 / Pb01) TaxID=502779 RepID=C1GTA3_PARBA|nr:hypothetical protein PAAG_01748 [Paracoccidioides lutzii Pb01]EEH39286.2 hypothetical protein PAAG_01748 [Paracoccidioides lutzii Pb01]
MDPVYLRDIAVLDEGPESDGSRHASASVPKSKSNRFRGCEQETTSSSNEGTPA